MSRFNAEFVSKMNDFAAHLNESEVFDDIGNVMQKIYTEAKRVGMTAHAATVFMEVFSIALTAQLAVEKTPAEILDLVKTDLTNCLNELQNTEIDDE